ncbi:MAG: diguanylate cyclase [Candidatus Omnitrophica bacterium]|nr:diguanylate cyclase [Candidatus Omnitrophota bacterium]
MIQYKILIVEDEGQDVQRLRHILEPENYEMIIVGTGGQALTLLEQQKPDLVILDILLPDIDGFEVCRRIKQMRQFAAVPVLFFSVVRAIDERLLGLELGAADFLSKSADDRELLVRVRNLLQTKKTIDDIVKQSFTDVLTDMYNRRYFQFRLDDEFRRGAQYRSYFSCAIIDVDHFKAINDQYGHLAGDRVLKNVAQVLRTSVRESDILCRYGGDEFGWLLPETDIEGAYAAAERVRRAVRAGECTAGGETVTISCGVSAFSPATAVIDDLLGQADNALYRAKEAGRDQTRVFSVKGG